MKKIFVFAAVVAVSLSMSAQKQMHVWVNGTDTKYAIFEVDSVTFSESPVDENQNKDNGIGVFSVADGKQVTFSKGNLQYNQSTDTWSFAENQCDYIGIDNVINGALADQIDLFGWSASNTTTPFGISASTDWENDYLGNFVDWGINRIGSDNPNTWRTLNSDEWNYLLFDRPNALLLKGVAQVSGVNGLILLPDNWICPEGIIFKSGFYSSYGTDKYADYQSFTEDNWSKLEATGAVFLPAAGERLNGSGMVYVQSDGYYWSSSSPSINKYKAYMYYFCSNEAADRRDLRCNGNSVRLVKDL